MKIITILTLLVSFNSYAEISKSCMDVFEGNLTKYKMGKFSVVGYFEASAGLKKKASEDKTEIFYYYHKVSARRNPLPSFYMKEQGDRIEMTLYQGKMFSSNASIKTVLNYNSNCSSVNQIKASRGSTSITLKKDICENYYKIDKQSEAEKASCSEGSKIEGLSFSEFSNLGYASLCRNYFPKVETIIEVPKSSSAESSSATRS